MSEKAYIEFRTHAVTIHRLDHEIRCFKFAGTRARPRCAYETFPTEEAATEWIVTPFPIDWFQLELKQE